MSGTELIAVGGDAPDFSLEGSDGATHRLSVLLRESAVVLFFYPGNDTPG